jgi:GTPase
MTNNQIPIVAIVGRPNVGKSSLFNRLINKRLAITSDIAGTTRDRIYYRAEINDIPAILVDTGGLQYGKKENIEADVESQVKVAIDDAHLIVFLLDAKEGLTVEDYKAAELLRKSKKKVLIAANKIDHKNSHENLTEFIKLGFGEPITLSAYHNINVSQLEDEIYQELINQDWKNKSAITREKDEKVSICFAGKPNVGKSSLVNALLGKTKVIVSDIPGTTRDTTDTEFTWNEQEFVLIDTAGLRRKGKIEKGLEKISTFRSLEAIERCDVACLVLDYSEGIRSQDQHIASYIQDAKKGLVIVINKSDLMEDQQKDEARMIRILRHRFDFLPWAPVIFTSAVNKSNLQKILELATIIYQERNRIIDADELKGFMQEITNKHLPPPVSCKIPKFIALRQVTVNPPTFVYWVNDPRAIHFSYKRYLENELRKRFGFTGTSIKIIYEKKPHQEKNS